MSVPSPKSIGGLIGICSTIAVAASFRQDFGLKKIDFRPPRAKE